MATPDRSDQMTQDEDRSLGARALRGSDGDRPGGALWLLLGLVALVLIVALGLLLLLSSGGDAVGEKHGARSDSLSQKYEIPSLHPLEPGSDIGSGSAHV